MSRMVTGRLMSARGFKYYDRTYKLMVEYLKFECPFERRKTIYKHTKYPESCPQNFAGWCET